MGLQMLILFNFIGQSWELFVGLNNVAQLGYSKNMIVANMTVVNMTVVTMPVANITVEKFKF